MDGDTDGYEWGTRCDECGEWCDASKHRCLEAWEESMNFERLENLIVALIDAAPSDPKDDLFEMQVYAHACGTPACVLGHYAARVDLQQILLPHEFGIVRSDGSGRLAWFGGDVVLEHFGITFDQAHELFGMDGCGAAQDRADAIAYIREFIDRHKAAGEV